MQKNTRSQLKIQIYHKAEVIKCGTYKKCITVHIQIYHKVNHSIINIELD